MEFDELPDGLRVRTPAKINLYLEVGDVRGDGFHEIDSLLQTVSLHDVLEFRETDDGEISLEEKGIADREENLVHRAAVLLRESGLLPAASRRGVRIVLEKRIPQGAGLGGGSSDAAATLVALARLWDVRASVEQLSEIAARLGSDVPFFLRGGTARLRGRGEHVTPWHEVFDHESFHYVVAHPGVHVPTGKVYESLDRRRQGGFTLTVSSPLDSMTSADIVSRFARGEVFYNRLEDVTCSLYPELGDVSSRMKEEPFTAVSMTGSGAAFFGLCRDAEEADRLARRLVAGWPPETAVYAVQSEPGYRFPWLAR
ncbi:MAG: 4-(cytidine 5'-diphospho)-2-C-methyl-D-erythritol kinase [Planctomycetota bacterium]|nr:4-(cytidine 5'-diphospho)-2-C-methyl-D-erythritol kinase [Planctomycetota bacterium]